MGKPAARLGDPTAHGGVIVVGAPTVLIGGAPAARVSDNHVCPMLNPGSPGPPHVGGPINLGSPTVLICGQMAARIGDMAVCQGPPDSIAAGCPTVLIGESSSGGGSAGAGGGGGAGPQGAEPGQPVEGEGGAAASGSGPASATGAVKSAPKPAPPPPSHFLKVKFIDKIGNVISGLFYSLKAPSGRKSGGRFGGVVDRKGVKPGSYEFTFPAIVSIGWSKRRAKPDEAIELTAELYGVPDGEKADIDVWERSPSRPRKMVKRIEGLKVQGSKVTSSWKFEEDQAVDDIGPPDPKLPYVAPGFYFTVKVAGLKATSGALVLLDVLKIELKDDCGDPVPDEAYLLYLPDGSVRKGQLDGQGRAEEKDVPIRGSQLFFPGIGGARPLPRE